MENESVQSEYRTNFVKAELDPGWDWVRQDPSKVKLGGGLHIQLGAPHLVVRPVVSGDWDIVTRVGFAPQVRDQRAGLTVYADDKHLFHLVRVFDGLRQRVNFIINAPPYCSTAFAGAEETATNIALRITKRGTTYSAYYRVSDDRDWTFVDRMTNVQLPPVRVGLLAEGPAGVSAEFTHFRIEPVQQPVVKPLPVAPARSQLVSPMHRQWTLATEDTRLTVGIDTNGLPYVCELANPRSGWNWTRNPAPIPLLERVEMEGVPYRTDWTFEDVEIQSNGGQRLSLQYRDKRSGLLLKMAWQSRPVRGPIHLAMWIVNPTRQAITIGEQESIDLSVFAPEGDAAVWYFHSGGCRPEGNGGGVYRVPLDSPKLPLKLVLDPETEWGQVETPGTYKHQWIPYVVLDAGGKHGVYIGWEWSVGRLAAVPNKQDRGLRLQAGNGDNFRTVLKPGQEFEVPPGFIGAYAGDLDDAGNGLRRYLYNYNLPPIARNAARYPRVEWNAFNDTAVAPRAWKCAEENYYPMVDAIAAMGVEEVMIDVGWWEGDAANQPATPVGDPVKWKSGMLAARDYAHGKGVNFGLYWNNNTPLTTEAGIEQRKREAQFLYKEYRVDSYRADGTDGNVVQIGGSGPGTRALGDEDVGYWQTKGFYEFIDWCNANIPQFVLENCTGGSRLKDFGLMKRSVRVQPSDAAGSTDTQRSLYDALYVYSPVQLMGFAWNGPGDLAYLFRTAAMGAPYIMFSANALSAAKRQILAHHIETYKKRIRPLLHIADVYHVFPRPDDVNWTGIEYLNPASGKGVVFIFKPEKGPDRWTVRLRGLDPDTSYRLEFADGSNASVVLSGRVLAESGVTVSLDGKGCQSELMFLEKETTNAR
jgi:hypothetical protein